MTLWEAAREHLGEPYALGAGLPGEPPHPPYTDCGLMTKEAILKAHGVKVQRTVTEQVAQAPYTRDVWGQSWEAVQNVLRPGDLIAFKWEGAPRPYSHTGVWTPQKTIIHASSSMGKVVESPPSYFAGGWKTIYSWQKGADAGTALGLALIYLIGKGMLG